jgi:hypothetical protein
MSVFVLEFNLKDSRVPSGFLMAAEIDKAPPRRTTVLWRWEGIAARTPAGGRSAHVANRPNQDQLLRDSA